MAKLNEAEMKVCASQSTFYSSKLNENGFSITLILMLFLMNRLQVSTVKIT